LRHETLLFTFDTALAKIASGSAKFAGFCGKAGTIVQNQLFQGKQNTQDTSNGSDVWAREHPLHVQLFRKGEGNMRNKGFNRTILFGLLLVMVTPAWAQRGQGRGRAQTMNGPNGQGTCLALINSMSKQALSSIEAAGIAYMREEEKLAHDVYAQLHSKWGLRVLGNISQSEERHFDVLKLLLDRYELQDPAAGRTLGSFTNTGLQGLYDSLIAEGEQSLNAALKVGAAIEDLDIRDLTLAAEATDNSDLKLVYQNLTLASENHMRTFVRQLNASGENYVPQYIDQAKFSEILAGTQQPGRGNGMRGKGPGFGRGNNGTCPGMMP
jgi:hypothetical protein